MKKTLYLCRILSIAILGLAAGSVRSQDIHFSQFGNSPLNLNPGLNGVFGGDMRFIGNYRHQWQNVPVPYTTFSGSLENKFYHRTGKYDRYFTGGLLFNFDQQGSLNLTSVQIGIPVGITMPVARNNFISLSATPAFGQRSFGSGHWTFDEGFVDCLYSSSNPTFEGDLASTSLQYFDLAAGLNYHWQAPLFRSRVDIGAGLHHINRPNHNFWGEKDGSVKLARRFAAYALGLAQVKPNLDLVLEGQYQRQGSYEELIYGGGVRLLLKPRGYDELAVQALFTYRHQDAIIWNFEVFWRTWTLGFSYDTNISDFTAATEGRGGPEVSLSYRLYKFKALRKYCPTDY